MADRQRFGLRDATRGVAYVVGVGLMVGALGVGLAALALLLLG